MIQENKESQAPVNEFKPLEKKSLNDVKKDRLIEKYLTLINNGNISGNPLIN